MIKYHLHHQSVVFSCTIALSKLMRTTPAVAMPWVCGSTEMNWVPRIILENIVFPGTFKYHQMIFTPSKVDGPLRMCRHVPFCTMKHDQITFAPSKCGELHTRIFLNHHHLVPKFSPRLVHESLYLQPEESSYYRQCGPGTLAPPHEKQALPGPTLVTRPEWVLKGRSHLSILVNTIIMIQSRKGRWNVCD